MIAVPTSQKISFCDGKQGDTNDSIDIFDSKERSEREVSRTSCAS